MQIIKKKRRCEHLVLSFDFYIVHIPWDHPSNSSAKLSEELTFLPLNTDTCVYVSGVRMLVF